MAAVALVGAGMLGGPGAAVAAPVDRGVTDVVPLAAGSSQLSAGETLSGGGQLVSPGGAYRLAVQADGNVVLYGPSGDLWSTYTFVRGTVLRMQGDGNLVAYGPDGRAVWDTASYGSGATRLVVQDDGNVVLYRPDGRAVWSTVTYAGAPADALTRGRVLHAGQQLVSPGGVYRLVVQADGNVVLYGPYGASWASGTFVRGTVLRMQDDGNLVAYGPDGRAVWHSVTYGSGATRLVVQDDGNAVLHRADGSAVWATGTVGGLPLSLRGRDVTVIPTARRVVALTFDAGANAAGLQSILATLSGRGVPATFFLTGSWVSAHPSGVAAIRAAGHRVGNHSMTHPDLTTLSDAAVRQQVLDAERAIRGAGLDPRPLFRFPFGARTPHTIDVVNSVGQGAVRWTVDTLGWKGTSGGMTAPAVADRALGALQPGEIVLMHIGSNPTDGSTLDADALPAVIDRMRSSGYGFVTLDALFG